MINISYTLTNLMVLPENSSVSLNNIPVFHPLLNSFYDPVIGYIISNKANAV
jgi:hypothetical protein